MKEKQDGPSLESSSYLNMTLRYLGPWDPLTFRTCDLVTYILHLMLPNLNFTQPCLPPPQDTS